VRQNVALIKRLVNHKKGVTAVVKNKTPKTEKTNPHALDFDTLDASRYLRNFSFKEKPKKKEPALPAQNDQAR